MTRLKRISDIEIEEDIQFQRFFWNIKRVGWIVMATFLLAAMTGIFGSGPLSYAKAQTTTATHSIEYERFARRLANTAWTVHIGSEEVEDYAKVSIDSSLMDHSQIESITPEPDKTEVGAHSIIYYFSLHHSDEPVDINVNLKLEKAGMLAGNVQVNESSPVHVTIFVYP